jgi:hypothetical protein
VERRAEHLAACQLGAGKGPVPGGEGGLDVVGRVVDADAGPLGAQPRERLVAPGRDADDAVERDGAVNVDVDQGDAVEPVECFPVGAPQPLAALGGFGEAGELGAADSGVDSREVGAQPEGLDGVADGR